ncbi:MAG TPA: aminotransferase class V-fold PLP-dependent enzyme [Chloroflexota bacterium]|nr:aminotransferase class V-fold PLP-dependent enzyme [Chloroflexota bacterium]
MTGYDALGVTPVINASATLTRLGGSRMPKPVMDAMAAGTEAFVDLVELQRRAGERIATLTGNEACYICSGAAAGIAIAVAACITGSDPAKIARLPHFEGPPAEVIIHRAHRNGYDHAARQTGVKLVEVGMAHSTQRWELETAITPQTACVLYFAGAHYATGALPLIDVIEIAHERGVPVLVDAAAQIPPIAALWQYTRELGADAAIFSGGKGLRGPQSSGLVLGRRAIVEACYPNGSPNQSIGRPMKVGKEETLGILAAVEWSLSQDESAILAGYEAVVQRWLAGLQEIDGVSVERGYPSEAGQPHGRAIVRISPTCPLSRDEVVDALWAQKPRIAVSKIGEDAIALNPQTLEPGEDLIVLDALRAVLTRVPVPAASPAASTG